MSSESQRELVKQWHAEHPGYAKNWREKYKQWRDSERHNGNRVRGNSCKRISPSKLAYEVHVSNPLTKIEKEELELYGLINKQSAPGSAKSQRPRRQTKFST